MSGPDLPRDGLLVRYADIVALSARLPTRSSATARRSSSDSRRIAISSIDVAFVDRLVGVGLDHLDELEDVRVDLGCLTDEVPLGNLTIVVRQCRPCSPGR